MVKPPSPPLTTDIAAALDWWREAGVDGVFTDEPQAWLADHASEEEPDAQPTRKSVIQPAPATPEPKIGGPRENWPTDLEAFRRWWLADPSLDEGGLAPRIAPEGPEGADLMVLVAMPEEADREHLLSGTQGQLLDGFLRAAGIAPDRVYRAAVLPRYTPLADWAEIERRGIAPMLAHHVAIARPKRLIAFGRNILPLCGHDPAQAAQKLRSFNHEGGRVPALFPAGLERLHGNWQLRARLWQQWLEWTENETWQAADG